MVHLAASDERMGWSRRDICSALATVVVAPGLAMQTRIRDEIRLPREGTFSLGDVMLESGDVLRQAFIGYKVHGQLNADRTNGVVYPTQFAAQHSDIEWLIGPGRALDSDRYFIVTVDQLGNGVSSPPSNTPAPQDRSRFPAVNIRDDVAAQYRLVTEGFGLKKLALVTGYSMGAQQAFQWAVSYPDLVERIAPFCGTAKTTAHNRVFLESVRTALTTDPAWMAGDYTSPPVAGLRALARVYAGWGFSQPFYNQELYRTLGLRTVDEVLTGFWEPRYMRRDANNLVWSKNSSNVDAPEGLTFGGFADHRDPHCQTRTEACRTTLSTPNTKITSRPPDLTHKKIVSSCPSIRLSTLSSNTAKPASAAIW